MQGSVQQPNTARRKWFALWAYDQTTPKLLQACVKCLDTVTLSPGRCVLPRTLNSPPVNNGVNWKLIELFIYRALYSYLDSPSLSTQHQACGCFISYSISVCVQYCWALLVSPTQQQSAARHQVWMFSNSANIKCIHTILYVKYCCVFYVMFSSTGSRYCLCNMAAT